MRLSTRERIVVGAGGALVLALVGWLAVLEPARTYTAGLEARVQQKQRELRDVQELANRYRQLQANSAEIERRIRTGQKVSIQSFLEEVAIEAKLRDRIASMRAKAGEITNYYRENAVEIKLERVKLPQLVTYLYRIEHPSEERSPGFLQIRQLRLRQRADDTGLLDAVFQVSSYEWLEKS